MKILQLYADVKVIEPEDLAKKVREEIARMKGEYGGRERLGVRGKSEEQGCLRGEASMNKGKSIVPTERVERAILQPRGQRVILDADLARLYGVTTKRLNQQVNRNRSRFPDDFMFQLTSQEKSEVVANCDHLSTLKFSPVLPTPLPNMVRSWRQACSTLRGQLRPAFLWSGPCQTPSDYFNTQGIGRKARRT